MFPTGHGATQCLVDPTIIQSLAENYPGAAELTPSQAYFKAYGATQTPLAGASTLSIGYAQTQSVIAQTLASPPAGSGLASRNASLINAGAAFHDNTDQWSPLDPSVRLVRMVGFDAANTEPDQGCSNPPCSGSQVGVFNASATVIDVDTAADSSGVHESTGGSGDGTVPLYSASVRNPAVGFDDTGGAHNIYWCAVSHFGLAWSTPVWQSAAAYFAGATEPSSDALGGACPDGSAGSAAPLLR